MAKGKVYLLPMTLGDTEIDLVIPQGAQNVFREVDSFIVENLKTTRRYLRKMDKQYPIDDKEFFVMDKRTKKDDIKRFVKRNAEKVIGVISEAGCPAIADPGSEVVAIAHEFNMEIAPLVGPSSILLALIASGMNGQNFTFNGYLPISRSERVKNIKNLERLSRNRITQVFMETPFRNNHMIEDLLIHCENNMKLCIATNISLPNQKIVTKTIAEWKKDTPDFHKQLCVFVM